MSTEAALLAAIDQHPGEDTPRLALADYYDESDLPQKACDQRLAVLLRAVKAAPEDDAPRLEYAEVCDQYGRRHRAEWIRVQVELARTPKELPKGTVVPVAPGSPVLGILQHNAPNPRHRELSLREDELWREFDPWQFATWAPKDWTATCHARRRWFRVGKSEREQNVWHVLRRGFVELITCEGSDWITHGDRIVAAQPVRTVGIVPPSGRALGGGFPEAVFGKWSRREGRPHPIGATLADCFRDLWGCEFVPHASADRWGAFDGSPVEDLRAMRELIRRAAARPFLPPAGSFARPRYD